MTAMQTLRKQLVSAVKDVGGNRREFIISTAAVDRDNDTINQNGWDLTSYRKNPVVLFAHDYSSLPIGKCVDIKLLGGQLIATVEFADTDMGSECLRLVDGGFLSATSVGFRPTSYEPNSNGGRDFQTQELLEFSIVPVPANPEAVVRRLAKFYGGERKLGRVLSSVNEGHVREALSHATNCGDHLARVLAELDDDDDVLDLDDDDDVELADVAAVLPGVMTDLAAELRQHAADTLRLEMSRLVARTRGRLDDPLPLDRVRHHAFGSDIELEDIATVLPGIMRTAIRDLHADVLRDVPALVQQAVRRARGRLD